MQRRSAHLHLPRLRSLLLQAQSDKQPAVKLFLLQAAHIRQPTVRATLLQAHLHAVQPHALKGHLRWHSSCSCQRMSIGFPHAGPAPGLLRDTPATHSNLPTTSFYVHPSLTPQATSFSYALYCFRVLAVPRPPLEAACSAWPRPPPLL